MSEFVPLQDEVDVENGSTDLPTPRQIAQAHLDIRESELKSDMSGKGFRIARDADLRPTADRIDADTLKHASGAGSVSLPPTVFSAPIALTLTSAKQDRIHFGQYLIRLLPTGYRWQRALLCSWCSPHI